MLAATTSSVDPVAEPRPAITNLLALISLAIVRQDHPEWTTASVATRADALSVSSERISRLKAVLIPRLEELVAQASQRGRHPFRWRTSFA